jgi:hypothetical protein
MPSTWENPLATNRALCLSILPSDAYLVQYTHLHLTSFLPFGRGTRSQVSFSIKERYSSFIVVSQSGRPEASANVSGS